MIITTTIIIIITRDNEPKKDKEGKDAHGFAVTTVSGGSSSNPSVS